MVTNRNRYRKSLLHKRLRRKLRIYIKLAALFLGCVFFLLLIIFTIKKVTLEPGEEEGYVPLVEAGNLTWLLLETAESQNVDISFPKSSVNHFFSSDAAKEGDGYLTFRQWQKLCEFFPEVDYELPKTEYQKRDKVRSADWYLYFDTVKAYCDPAGTIRDIPMSVLAVGSAVTDFDGKRLSDKELISQEKRYYFFSERFKEQLYQNITAVEKDGNLYAIRNIDGQNPGLFNGLILEASDGKGSLFWNDFECEISLPEDVSAKECVADLHFKGNSISKVDIKTEKISGKLLRITSEGAEIEGHGTLPFADKLKIYRLYGTLKKLYTKDLCIGYTFTDFVLEDGHILAALVTKEQKMENIRVLIKTSGYGSAYHEKIMLQADCDCYITTGKEYQDFLDKRALEAVSDNASFMKGQLIKAGEKIELSASDGLFEDDRVYIVPTILTGHIQLLNIERSQGNPSYRGSFEIRKTADGLVVINEVLLEEYLYSVVPSEMPASYPLEALMSQAVCARTYAYGKMMHAGLAAYGAHVDDSAAFQVYNNIEENSETTKAVRETKGKVLAVEDEMAEVFYYSTSCGYGTDAEVWKAGNKEEYPYLVSKSISDTAVTASVNSGSEPSADLQNNEAFRSFLEQGNNGDYEKEEPWYRWSYQVEELNVDTLNTALRLRKEANSASVLIKTKGGSFKEGKLPAFKKITGISILSRNNGGVAQELLITGDSGSVLVKTEHSIRYVLCDGIAKAVRRDGSEVACRSMIPSAYCVIDTIQKNGKVVGYTLMGGGFGHGVGLSQNGAKNMALLGMSCEDILNFFFEGCNLSSIYTEEELDQTYENQE